jgi:hypothetical protein
MLSSSRATIRLPLPFPPLPLLRPRPLLRPLPRLGRLNLKSWRGTSLDSSSSRSSTSRVTRRLSNLGPLPNPLPSPPLPPLPSPPLPPLPNPPLPLPLPNPPLPLPRFRPFPNPRSLNFGNFGSGAASVSSVAATATSRFWRETSFSAPTTPWATVLINVSSYIWESLYSACANLRTANYRRCDKVNQTHVQSVDQEVLHARRDFLLN